MIFNSAGGPSISRAAQRRGFSVIYSLRWYEFGMTYWTASVGVDVG